ncbi:hypothetical protein EJB05_40631, partial [Eragrostis curvula]
MQPALIFCRRPPTPCRIEDRPSTSSQLLGASFKHDQIPRPPSTRSRRRPCSLNQISLPPSRRRQLSPLTPMTGTAVTRECIFT